MEEDEHGEENEEEGEEKEERLENAEGVGKRDENSRLIPAAASRCFHWKITSMDLSVLPSSYIDSSICPLRR